MTTNKPSAPYDWHVRDAQAADAAAIGALFLQAGEGLYEFLLGGVLPDTTPTQALTHLVEAGEGPMGWHNCRVAVHHDGMVVGMVNAFAASQMDHLMLDMIPADRTTHVAPLFQGHDPQAMVLHAISVVPTMRGAGLGRLLAAEALGMAGAAGCTSLSLLVWSNNLRGIKLFEGFGFERRGQIDLPGHPRLSARRAIRMTRAITPIG